MKALKYGFGLILVGGFALTASCGGTSDDSSSPSGGTSSTTGGTSSSLGGSASPTGGTSTGTGIGGTTTTTSGGTGDTGNPTGGTGNATGGTGNPTGGTGNPAGGTGNPAGGTGGGVMNPPGCPETAPAITAMGMPGEMCTPLAMPQAACAYPMGANTERCTCRPARGGGRPGRGPGGGEAGAPAADDTWRCVSVPTPVMCPAMPATGDACSGMGCPLKPRGFCACRMGKLACPMGMGMGMGAAGAGN